MPKKLIAVAISLHLVSGFVPIPAAAPPRRVSVGVSATQQHLATAALALAVISTAAPPAAFAMSAFEGASSMPIAGRSGGRMGGGGSFRSAPRMAAPRGGGGGSYRGGNTYRSTTIISPGGMGMGYGGYGMGYGGFGISPGTYLGLSVADSLIQGQRRQALMNQQLQLAKDQGADEANINALTQQLAQQQALLLQLQQQQQQQQGAPQQQQLQQAPPQQQLQPAF